MSDENDWRHHDEYDCDVGWSHGGHDDPNEPYSWMEGPNVTVTERRRGAPWRGGADPVRTYASGGSGCILPILLLSFITLFTAWMTV